MNSHSIGAESIIVRARFRNDFDYHREPMTKKREIEMKRYFMDNKIG